MKEAGSEKYEGNGHEGSGERKARRCRIKKEGWIRSWKTGTASEDAVSEKNVTEMKSTRSEENDDGNEQRDKQDRK